MITIRRLIFLVLFVGFAVAMGAQIGADNEQAASQGAASLLAFLLLCYDFHTAEQKKDLRKLLNAEGRARAAFQTIKNAIDAYEDGSD